VSDPLSIRSFAGTYQVDFLDGPVPGLQHGMPEHAHFVVDRMVFQLYEKDLSSVIGDSPVLKIDALETNKSLDKMPLFITSLIEGGLRRGRTLVAVGGGIIQDIACFISSIVYRGVPWIFVPTTLLAQADSCIGSKSSINNGHIKNVVGTFHPPVSIAIHPAFLGTLNEQEIESGIGEMLKVNMLDGRRSFASIAEDYPRLRGDSQLLARHVRRALEIKKRFIEQDEFDRGVRNLLNYGHSFGHAIEAATNFGVPHGIAVTIGMDMANFYSAETGRIAHADFEWSHAVLRANYRRFEDIAVPLDAFVQAITRDKKNAESKLALILPSADMRIEKVFVEPDDRFRNVCRAYFDERIRA